MAGAAGALALRVSRVDSGAFSGETDANDRDRARQGMVMPRSSGSRAVLTPQRENLNRLNARRERRRGTGVAVLAITATFSESRSSAAFIHRRRSAGCPPRKTTKDAVGRRISSPPRTGGMEGDMRKFLISLCTVAAIGAMASLAVNAGVPEISGKSVEIGRAHV